MVAEGEVRELKYKDSIDCCFLEPEGAHMQRHCKKLNSVQILSDLGSRIFLRASK